MTAVQEQSVVRDYPRRPARIRVRKAEPGEFANALTHGIGLLLSVAGAVVLLDRAVLIGDTWRVVGCAIFVATLMSVYAASTLSHGLTHPNAKRWFRILDQGFIFLLIVGTYTPFALTCLRTGGWLLFLGLLWTLAFAGFVSKVVFAHRIDSVSVWACLVLGWLPSFSIPTLLHMLPFATFWWMLAGGLSYSFGTLFLVSDQRHPYFHAIWHLFVISGSVCHFLAIMFFLTPLTTGAV
jgi:hemolysin III